MTTKKYIQAVLDSQPRWFGCSAERMAEDIIASDEAQELLSLIFYYFITGDTERVESEIRHAMNISAEAIRYSEDGTCIDFCQDPLTAYRR